jgi:signal transduction histidine kinase
VPRSPVLLSALVAVAGTIEMVAIGQRWVVVACLWLGAAALAAARVAPLAVPSAATAAWALALALDADAADPAAWVLLLAAACFACGLYATRRASLAAVLLALGGVVAALLGLTDLDASLPFGLVVSVGPWTLGAALRTSLERNRRLAAEAEHARLERGLARERAATAERERIAGELSDVLAHALGAMVVRASVAADLVLRDVEGAAAGMRAVAEAGRDALAETGRLLRLLRDDHGELALTAAPGTHERPAAGDRAGRNRLAVDALLPAAFGLAGAVEIAASGLEPFWPMLAVNWLAAAVLVARRAVPLAMPVAVAAILLAGSTGDEDPAAWILLSALACLAAGLHSRARPLGLAAVLAASGLLILTTTESSDVVLVLTLAVGGWAVGAGLARTLDRTRRLSAAAERARVERELEAERAAATERRRIARELHDVLANSLSVMIVQASLAADLAAGDPAAAATAVAEVERAGRAGLAETGRLLRLIGEGGTTEPQPGVADLPALADEYARAGLGVELELEDVVLPAGVGLSAYRIVQEALTNALKHAPGSEVRVRLACDGGAVAVEVRNGRAVAPALAVSGGHGLAGLRERASLFGGRLDAGPTADGGFVLAATLPVDE